MSGTTETESPPRRPLYCSFCGKSEHDVPKIIAGPSVYICDECVELCVDIIDESRKMSPNVRARRAIEADLDAVKSITRGIQSAHDSLRLALQEAALRIEALTKELETKRTDPAA